MNNTLSHYGFFALAILVGITGLLAALWRSRRVATHARTGKRSIFDYLLLWPLLIGTSTQTNADENQTNRTRKRVIVGWLIVLILVISAMFFGW